MGLRYTFKQRQRQRAGIKMNDESPIKLNRRHFLAGTATLGAAAGLTATLAGCGRPQKEESHLDMSAYSSLLLDMGKWNYDEDNNVYYQLGIPYVQNPVAADYQKLSIYVPGNYFAAEKNGDTYKVILNPEGIQGRYTGATAPVVMPLNCKNFSAQIPATSYSYEGLAPYMSEGVIYVFTGCRGKTSGYVQSNKEEGQYPGGAPFTVIDVKSAIRFVRLNAPNLPGSAGHVALMGVSAAGAIATTVGVSGDTSPYANFMKDSGAALWNTEGILLSDAPDSVMVWNPQIDLNTMDAAYEWLYGQYSDEDSRAPKTFGHAYSHALASDYANVVNGYNFSQNDTRLSLEETSGGIFTDGNYYNAVIAFLQDGAKDFFANTAFPATITKNNHIIEAFPGAQGSVDADALVDGSATSQSSQPGVAQLPSPATVEYASAHDYISALNAHGVWITLNARRGTVRIESIEDYIKTFAPPVRPVSAFDSLQKNTEQNQYFGTIEQATLHYSQLDADNLANNQETYATLAGYDATYLPSYQTDLAVTYDKAEDRTTANRQSIDNPFLYIVEGIENFGMRTVAKHWRIHVGLAQSSIPFICGFNLALALRSYQKADANVNTVDCAGIWEEGSALTEVGDNTVQSALAWLATKV